MASIDRSIGASVTRARVDRSIDPESSRRAMIRVSRSIEKIFLTATF